MGANHLMQTFFQRVLNVSVPRRSVIRLGPEIADIVIASQPWSDQVVYFIVPALGRRNAVLRKNPLAL
jgi:hypothetical protein